MKMSEYAAAHAADGKKVDIENIVSAQTLVNEIVEFTDLVRIEKTKYGRPCWMIKIQDGSGFFTSSSLTRQIDKYIASGVGIPDLIGCRFLIMQKHLDADASKDKKACDFLQFGFVEDTKETSEETEE